MPSKPAAAAIATKIYFSSAPVTPVSKISVEDLLAKVPEASEQTQGSPEQGEWQGQANCRIARKLCLSSPLTVHHSDMGCVLHTSVAEIWRGMNLCGRGPLLWLHLLQGTCHM